MAERKSFLLRLDPAVHDALARWAGSPAAAEVRLRAAGIDPATRGEQLSVTDFARLAATVPVEP